MAVTAVPPRGERKQESLHRFKGGVLVVQWVQVLIQPMGLSWHGREHVAGGVADGHRQPVHYIFYFVLNDCRLVDNPLVVRQRRGERCHARRGQHHERDHLPGVVGHLLRGCV